MIHHLNQHYLALALSLDYRVEESPEIGEILYVEILQTVLIPENRGNRTLSDHFSVETVGQEQWSQRADSPGN